MAKVNSSALRQGLAALVVLALTFAGVGRGLAVTQALATVPGFAPICHGGPGPAPDDRSAPAGPHKCCDACVLNAPVLPPAAPRPAALAWTAHPASFSPSRRWAPRLSDLRAAKQARGPPLA